VTTLDANNNHCEGEKTKNKKKRNKQTNTKKASNQVKISGAILNNTNEKRNCETQITNKRKPNDNIKW
jgi:hypothetical protein